MNTLEGDTVEMLEAEAAKGGLAIVGVKPTLKALEGGQVDKLIMSASFTVAGWRCSKCMSYGDVGIPTACPYCGGNVWKVNLRESMVREAERSGASVEIVADVPRLDELGGVGAFLRYPSSSGLKLGQ